MMKIVVGCDHAGFPMRDTVAAHLERAGHEVLLRGAASTDPVDFPDVVQDVCGSLFAEGADRAVLVCGTGIGACMAANKVPGVRAALAHDHYSAHQAVEHDDANVLCVGAQVVGPAVLRELLDAFLEARWDGSEHFARRVRKLNEMDGTARRL
jgi:ribose 5-phosphate isomerase B